MSFCCVRQKGIYKDFKRGRRAKNHGQHQIFRANLNFQTSKFLIFETFVFKYLIKNLLNERFCLQTR